MRLERERRVLLAAIREAGRMIRTRIGSGSFQYKGRANLVTETDKRAQEAILSRIRRAFPDHGYLAEEDARKDARDWTWVIDPLDGTTNFAHGYPVCCVSIGLLKGGRSVLAGVLDPFRDELFLAQEGKGMTLNGKRAYVSRTNSLSESLLLTGFPYDRQDRALFYTRLYAKFMSRCHDVRRSGSAALDLAWTAVGRVEGFWEFNLAPWDVAAGWLLVKEAGGKVTDFEGKAWKGLKDYGRRTLATNGHVHAEMLKILRPHD